MFATSTKTATFLPTLSPIPCLGLRRRSRRAPGISTPAPGGIHGSPEDRLLVLESLALPALELCRCLRHRRLDRRTTLVARRLEAFLDEACAHGVRCARRVDDEQIDDPDVAAGANRGSDREHGAADDVPLALGNQDGGVREEDELAEHIGGAERTGRTVSQAIAAQCDESLDVGDAGRSDPVLHAAGCSLTVGGAVRFLAVVATVADQTAGFAGPREDARCASVSFPGRERPALQSVRRSLSYVIASAATCAPPEVGFLRTARNAPAVEPPASTVKGRSDPPAHRQAEGRAPERRQPTIRPWRRRAPTEVDRDDSRPTWRIGGGNWMKLTRLAGAAGIAIIALGAIGCSAGPGGGATYNVGIDMPQQGSELA